MSKIRFGLNLAYVSLVSCTGGSAGPDGPSDSLGRVVVSAADITLVCAADGGGDVWSCPEEVRVDCGSTAEVAFEVASPGDETCDVDTLVISPSEPLTPGTHEVTVRNAQDELLCTSELIVQRSTPLRLVPHSLELWPPNHKLHEISVADCVDIVGACPGEVLSARFVWASSDEPVDARGDGHHEPDIMVSSDCQRLSLRAERQGPQNGRVYSLGVSVLDAAGVAVETTCTVSVAHDQSGRPAQPGPDAYRIELDGNGGLPSCGRDDDLL